MTAPRVDGPAVSDRYVRQERLGSGGFGVVWCAHDTLLRRDVALKEVYVPTSLTTRSRRRFVTRCSGGRGRRPA